MAIVDLVMPKLGESIMEATILKWHKQPGDSIKMDETLLEIATDKVDSEVPSTSEGTIEEILFKENDVVPIGMVIARINDGGNTEQSRPQQQTQPEPQREFHTPPPVQEEQEETSYTEVTSVMQDQPAASSPNGRFYSPLVLNIAASEGVSMTELEKIPGTGNEGRVTKKDILQFVSDRKSGKIKPQHTTQAQTSSQHQQTVSSESSPPQQNQLPVTQQRSPVATNYSGNVEIIEMDRMRKLIADHMVRSKQTSPHVTSFTEADVTNLVMWRNKVKKEFEKREGSKITFTPLFIEAIVKCIKRFPLINCSLDGNNIIIKKDINIGMATALPSGNLIVPVIKNADQLNLTGLTKQVNQLADNARNNKLKADDTQGGTFTFTNVGTFGSLMGTPIINQPQVAILALGAIKKRPVVIETPHGDSIAIRHMMYLSMSYDHRIVDGSLGATFLTAVANELENFNSERDY
ncbi:MAG: 2-oxo acid dehydrogenase subunit E2, partial [Chitinophagaceae bacterium]|nr:2-oxo acid dehydrogenase subunit E2 [Chitinophagaceae bacterium]